MRRFSRLVHLNDVLHKEFTVLKGGKTPIGRALIEPVQLRLGVQSQRKVQVVWLHESGKEFLRFEMPFAAICAQINSGQLVPRNA